MVFNVSMSDGAQDKRDFWNRARDEEEQRPGHPYVPPAPRRLHHRRPRHYDQSEFFARLFEMENVIGGKLKLKKPLESGIKKKRKSGEGASKAVAERAEEAKVEHEDPSDPRTKYEKKWEDQVKRMESKNAKKLAQKSHRDRINDFNEKLSTLSEHYDIPRVAGGG